MIHQQREQRIEEILNRVLWGYTRQVQVDLQEYPSFVSDETQED